ncbi:TetR/AcrR family transcriptional regulator [Kitasatospora sp. NBC_01287]|uniref:TetR/AcrR family transcriptional regulator n=1 Tax=Kitasatospora sp. NBC_01287 TaxID=2903573 RepID=UPI002250B2C4|nr:TetR/AcrR family transcriptional regulator [Kitasatospora sp. NBC_01287]MCX4745298.1 TetR/AcrR family transcriptional regulator [Kitasatospora sp. NBC_01287]
MPAEPPVPAGRPMRADARRNYERLLAAAAEAFAERGAGASMDEIAKRAQVGAGTLYRHFPTREELVAAVYRAGLEEACAQARSLLERSEPGEALFAWLPVLATHWRDCGELKTLLAAAAEHDGELLSGLREQIVDTAEAVLADARAAGTVRDDLRTLELLRMLHAAVMAAGDWGGSDVVTVERMVELVVDGLCPRG